MLNRSKKGIRNKANDPYRWLEKDSAKTRQWIQTQEKSTKKYFADTNLRTRLRQDLTKLLDVGEERLPSVRGTKYFFRKRKRGEEQSSLYLKYGLKGKHNLLINPSKLKFGTIEGWYVSKDARYIVIEFSVSSNDRHTIKVFDVAKKIFLKDTITNERYPFFQSWQTNSSGFWYVRGESGHPATEEKYHKRLYYHTLGQPVSADKLVPINGLTKDDWPSIHISNDGRYQLITIHHLDRNTTVYFRYIGIAKSKLENITKGLKAFSYAEAEDGYIYLFTNHRAPNKKILRRKIRKNTLGKWEVYISESKYKIGGHRLLKDYLALEYIENVSSKVYLINLKNKKKINIKLPGIGTLLGQAGEYKGKELFFSFSSLNIPTSIYRFDLKNLDYKLYWRTDIKVLGSLELKQKLARSEDGTMIPFFILRKRGTIRPSPNLVNAYGGFGVSELPIFRPALIPFLERGGVFVLANIRGGSEFGKKWHEAIIKKKQHKRFEDLKAVLDYLINRRYTTSEKLALSGGSNGGLLMAVMALRYPNLFRAALIDVPVTDMLRFHLFHGGRFWINDYGSPEDKNMAKYLLSYSPYHNVSKEEYPAMMIMTAEHDDRVHPMHAFKFFARLKENNKQRNAIILRVERKAGHGGSGKLGPVIDKLTDTSTFLFKELGVKI